MRRLMIAVIAVTVGAAALVGSPRTASATEIGYRRNFGIGLMLGEPTGITGKYWISSKTALDFGLGFGYGNYYDRRCDRFGCYGGYEGVSLNADYLWHPSVLVRGPVELLWHIGVGGRIWFWNYRDRNYDTRGGLLDAAIRMPIGLDLMFANPNFLEIYGEVTPSLYLFGPYLGFEGGLGIRFYF